MWIVTITTESFFIQEITRHDGWLILRDVIREYNSSGRGCLGGSIDVIDSDDTEQHSDYG